MADDKKFTEDAYEQTLIALFRNELGYAYECGYEVERDYREPFYRADLLVSMRRLNPSLPADAMEQGIKQITNISIGTLEQNNEQFTLWMQNGLEVGYLQDGEERTALMRLIDYERPERNFFKVVNQWRVEEYKNKRCDMVVMVNGLPLVVVELKSAVSEDATIDDAYKQIKNYQQSVPSLFSYNAFNVISDMSETRAGTITAKETRYMEWKTVDGSYESTLIADYRTFFLGMFQQQRLLDILQNYICFDKNQGRYAKILTAYHQYYAVGKALERTKEAVEGNGKIGVFWHTQGSGKSLSMVFYAHQLVQRLPEVTIVVVTDRKDLDNQLFGQFCRCKDFLRQEPVNAQSRSDLGRLLQGRQSGGIIFTTIQKFEEGDTPLSPRRNIIVMSDEAHRSQYGDEHWDAQSQRMKKGFSQKMREALPGASFIGFTGTPISDRDRDTEEVFGHYIDIYDMSQAVDDGATRPVYYESRVVNLRLDDDTMKLLNDEFDHLGDEGATEEQIRKAKQEHSRLEVLLGEDATIDTLTRDIVHHYEDNRAQELTGKAMIVALTRPIAIKIYRKILELRPGWTEKVKVVMSGSNQDPEDWQQIIGNEAYKKELARKFKDDDDPMKIAIVRDMWLTGFDVPSLATMYVYKPMSGHNLMQAIARVNRVFPGKEGGLIVDYVGIAQALKSAMQQYTNRDRHRFGDPDIAKTALLKWREEMEVCRDQLHGFDYTGFFAQDNTKRAAAITAGANYLSAPALLQKKKDFMEHSALLHNATTLCRSLLDERQKTEGCYMDALRVMMLKLSQKGKISRHEINERIGDLLRQSVKTDGVINLFGDRQIEFSLFEEAFLQEVKNMKERNLAVELLIKLLKERIRQQQKTNITQSDLFSDMLSRSLSNYLKGLLTNEEVIQELLKMAQQMKHAEDEGNDLGLTSEEKAFYDALSTPEGVRQAYSDEEFVALTKELTEVLHTNRTIDWNRKESARAKMRVLVKRLLKKYKYPPEGAKKALETVMRQCDHWADDDENVL
uniref:type I restriction endonuclease subunit R n=1 Tax=Prevotella sp. TaxID=59823 RepID=UPI003FF081CF